MYNLSLKEAGAGEVHAWLSPLDSRFREIAAGDERYLRRSTFSVLDREHPLLRYSPQSWPTFMDRSRVRELARIGTGLSELIRGLPARVFDRDPERIARFYDVEEPFARTMLAPPDGIAGALSRGDFVLAGNGFQCLEFNMTTNLGGWAAGLLSRMLVGIPEIARFVEASGAVISHRNPLRRMLAHALEEARRDGLVDAGEFNLLVGTREAERLAGDPHVPQFLDGQHQKMLRQHAPEISGAVSIRNYSDLAVVDGALYDGPRRLHAVLERHTGAGDENVLRCFKSGRLQLYNGPAAEVLSDKRNLALLSETAEADLWSAAERRLIQDHVPWTRRVLPGETLCAGERTPLAELLRRERPRFVLKKARSVGGVGVVIGRFAAAEEWEAALAAALSAGDWIAQQYVESRPFLYQSGAHGACPHDVIWGPYVFGARYGGAILKVQPKGLGRVVNLWRGATEGVLFEVDDGTPPVG
jgi:hypothetical protein